MRSGLQKPGAIPFLALLVFLLLSLVPSLAKEWDLYSLQLRYIGYPRHEVRHLPRVKDGPTDIRSRLRSPGAPCKPWTLIDGSCPLNPLSRPRSAVLDTPSRSSLEAALTFDPEANSYPTESSSFSRGMRAFKTFLTKRLDDLATRDASFEAVPARPMSTLRNASAAFAATGKETAVPESLAPDISQAAVANASLPRLFSLNRDSWQLVCQAGRDYFGNITRLVPLKIPRSLSFLQRDAEPQSSLDDSAAHSGQQSVPKRAVLDDNQAVKPACSPTFRPVAHAMPTQTPNQTTSAAEHSIGLDQRPEHMRGSCMAIVISLVVGVMWF